MTESRYVPCATAAPESVDARNRTLTATITSNAVDRDGEIVEPTAFKQRIGTFQKNPVLLWMHNPFVPPIGKVLDLRFVDNRIDATLRFSPEGRSTLADEVWASYADGALTSFSIGFRVHEVDRSARPHRIVDAELLEVSAVTVPANPEATAKSLGAAKRLGFLALREELKHRQEPTGGALQATTPDLSSLAEFDRNEFWRALAKSCLEEVHAPTDRDQIEAMFARHAARRARGETARAEVQRALGGWTRLLG